MSGQIKLYMSDLDGTLLNNNGSLSSGSKEKLNIAIERGIKITVATARSKKKTLELLEGLNLNLPMIVLNGAQLISSNGDVISERSIDEISFNSLVYDIEKMNLAPIIIGEENGKDVLMYPLSSNKYVEKFVQLRGNDSRLKGVKGAWILPYKIFVLNVLGPLTILEKLLELVEKKGSNFNTNLVREIYIDGCYSLEFRDKLAEKSIMLNELCAFLKMKPSEICYFGDELNDINIFKLVGKKIAVSNATQLIKSMADEIIATNDEDAVANYLYKLI